MNWQKLESPTAGRLGRKVLVLGVTGATVGGMLLGAGAAQAAVGTPPGTVELSQSSGLTSSTPTWSTTTGCKPGFQGSAVLREVNSDGTTTDISPIVTSVTGPFSGTLLASIAQIQAAGGIPNGATQEWVVFCFSGSGPGTGGSDPEMNTFISYSADGSVYTTSATPPGPTNTTTMVATSANPSVAGHAVTYTATVSPTPDGGTVAFTDGGAPITGCGAQPVDTSTGKATCQVTYASSGVHTITASYGGDGNFTGSTSAPLTQTVNQADTDLTLSAPPDVTTDATGPSGATVTYQLPQASDPDDTTVPAATCSPAPAAVFAIGTTTVNCSVTDPDDTPSTAIVSFTVTVLGAASQLAALSQQVQGLPPGGSLSDKVATAQSDLAAGNTSGACETLTEFIRQVQVQSGKGIPAATAAQLIAAAQRIKAVLAC